MRDKIDRSRAKRRKAMLIITADFLVILAILFFIYLRDGTVSKTLKLNSFEFQLRGIKLKSGMGYIFTFSVGNTRAEPVNIESTKWRFCKFSVYSNNILKWEKPVPCEEDQVTILDSNKRLTYSVIYPVLPPKLRDYYLFVEIADYKLKLKL